MKKNKVILLLISVILIMIIVTFTLYKNNSKEELIAIKSEKELENIYEGEIAEKGNWFIKILGMPMSLLIEDNFSYNYDRVLYGVDAIIEEDMSSSMLNSSDGSLISSISKDSILSTSSSKEYSTTNIQVENVDEADITKTDGDYIYSISNDNVVITNVIDPTNIKVSAKIVIHDSIPEDLMLYEDKLVIISTNENVNTTIVNVYNIMDKEHPQLVKSYELFEPYYTSRCIDGKLYVIASGKLRKDNKKIITYYIEDDEKTEIDLKNIKYLKDLKTNKQTIISMLDLNKPTEQVNISSYLIDVSNAYISEKNIYLLDYEMSYYDDVPPVKTLFGFKGALGPFLYENEDEVSNYKTMIYKFNLLPDGRIKYEAKTKIEGKTINQFSLDEHNENLRVALYDQEGSRIVILDKNLNEIGKTSYLAKDENMYSSRFIGDRAYLVTYKTIDPLYVIDISNPQSPKVLGKLKIPGYSTYLHPYDENHLIGIGMETKENTYRDSMGKVISTSASIVGMKMALFDVTDVENPIQISNTVIGDSRATSAILTNHKALLFSKEKELIAIPVNNYAEDFELTKSTDSHASMIESYKNYRKPYISEGYFVYKINLKEGFSLRGIINHEKKVEKYSYSNTSKLLRGLYIEDNLFTVSEDAIKVNRLSDLEQISEIALQQEYDNESKKTDEAKTQGKLTLLQ